MSRPRKSQGYSIITGNDEPSGQRREMMANDPEASRSQDLRNDVSENADGNATEGLGGWRSAIIALLRQIKRTTKRTIARHTLNAPETVTIARGYRARLSWRWPKAFIGENGPIDSTEKYRRVDCRQRSCIRSSKVRMACENYVPAGLGFASPRIRGQTESAALTIKLLCLNEADGSMRAFSLSGR